MLRLTEAALFLAPFALFAAWWVLGWRSRRVFWAAVAAVAVLGAGLTWFGLAERLPAGSRYVPAQLQGGRIVPGHGT